MRSFVVPLLVAGVLVSSLSGCAAIFHGALQPVSIGCPIQGAAVRVDGIPGAPGRFLLSREYSHTVTVDAPGYQPASVVIERHLSGGLVVLDVVLCFLFPVWGIPSTIVDAATGDYGNLEPEAVNITLVREAKNP